MPDLQRLQSILRIPVLALIVLSALVHLLIPCLNHYCFRTFAFDYGVYNFAWYDFAHLRSSPVPIYLTPFPLTFLQDHLSFLIPLLAPLYWIAEPLTGSYSLLIIQWLLILMGTWFTYRLALAATQDQFLSYCAALMYLLLPARFSCYQSDCNLVTMGSNFLPMLLYYIYTEKTRGTVLSCLLLLITREDFCLTGIFTGICFMASRTSSPRFRLGVTTALISLAYFLLAFLVVIPRLEDPAHPFSLFNYSALGDDPFQAIKNLIAHPLDSIQLLFINHMGEHDFKDGKMKFYLDTLLCGGFLLFLKPRYLWIMIPLIFKKMYNDLPERWTNNMYYGVEIAALLPAFVFLVISTWNNNNAKMLVTLALLLLCWLQTVQHLNRDHWGKYNFMRSGFYRKVPASKAVHEELKDIPSKSSVSATSPLVPHLAMRDSVLYLPNYRWTEYFCLLREANNWPLDSAQVEIRIEELRNNSSYRELADTSNIIIFRRTK